MSSTFESGIPPQWLSILLDIGVELGFDPTSSLEMEAWCARLVRYHNPSDEAGVRRTLGTAFRCLDNKPQWIQNPNWQVGPSGPMIFVGQLDCPPTPNLFHDHASFYVFFDPSTGERRTVLQVA